MKSTFTHKRTLLLVLLATAMVVALTPFASASGVTCRTGVGCLNGTDSFDWTTNFGPPFTNIPNNSTATSNGGVQATVVFGGSGDGQRRDQTTGGWNGNFTPGDELLWTQFGNGPLTFNFRTPVSGVGAQIQADFFGAFTAMICDQRGNCFSENGNSNSNGDGSAIFIGLANDPGITSVTFSLTACSNDCANFAINQMDITTGQHVIPEPASLFLLGSGLLGLGGLARKRIKKT